MEIEVTSTHGIPESGVLAVRAGHTRKQVALSSTDGTSRSARFPASSIEDATASLKVDVMDLLGRGRIQIPMDSSSSDREREFRLPVDGLQGDRPMEVSFVLRRLGEGHGRSLTSTQAASFGKLVLSADETSDREEALTSAALTAAKRRREESGAEYLEEHGVRQFLQHVVHALMKDKPADPYLYLQTQVALRVNGSGEPLQRPELQSPKAAEPVAKPDESAALAEELQSVKTQLAEQAKAVETAKEEQKASLEKIAQTQGLTADLQKQVGSLQDLQKATEGALEKASLARDQQEKNVSDLEKKLSQETIKCQRLEKLLAEAEAVQKKLREDLTVKSASATKPVPEEPAVQVVEPPKVDAPVNVAKVELPTIDAPLGSIKEIAMAQDDVQNLAKENAVLADELTRMRDAIMAVRNEIGGLQKKKG